jgi:DNA-binding transcriptional LysR family regulator
MMLDEISGDIVQWLRGFYLVAEEGSIRQAAIAMGREKPTISRQIQCLEKELGVTLFDRSSGKMMITPEGKILKEEAVGLFEYLKRIKGKFNDEETNFQGRICIATSHEIIYSVLPPYIEDFQRLHPEVTFQINGHILEVVYERVESAEADFGISVFETGHKTLVCHDLFQASMIMIAPKHKPFFPVKALPTLKQIAEVPLILFTHRGLHRQQIEERFDKDGLKPNVVMLHNSFVSIKRYVARGMGVAILSEQAISQEDEQYFNIYSLDRYFPRNRYVILLNKKKYHPAMVKALIRTLKPDINFSANPGRSMEAPVLSMNELLRRKVGITKAEAPTGRANKRGSR